MIREPLGRDSSECSGLDHRVGARLVEYLQREGLPPGLTVEGASSDYWLAQDGRQKYSEVPCIIPNTTLILVNRILAARPQELYAGLGVDVEQLLHLNKPPRLDVADKNRLVIGRYPQHLRPPSRPPGSGEADTHANLADRRLGKFQLNIRVGRGSPGPLLLAAVNIESPVVSNELAIESGGRVVLLTV